MQYRITLEREEIQTLTLQIEAPNHQIAQAIARNAAPHLHFPPNPDPQDIAYHITSTHNLPEYEQAITYDMDSITHITTTNSPTTLCGQTTQDTHHRLPHLYQDKPHITEYTECETCKQLLQTHQHTNDPNEITQDEIYSIAKLLILNQLTNPDQK